MQDPDRNFDDLALRMKRNVYSRLKGHIRLAVLWRDLREVLGERLGEEGPQRPLRILDAGGGQGQFSLSLAKAGHRVVICDISRKMLAEAREQASQWGIADQVEFRNCAIQALGAEHNEGYDLVLCHAVLEWVAKPRDVLNHLARCLRAGGHLSLTFYNVNSIIMKNLLRGNFSKVKAESYQGYRGSLTPTWPREIDEVRSWLDELDLQQLSCSGVRCFHDYLLQPELREKDSADQVELELRLSRYEPWRSLARYVHVLSRKSLA